MRETSVGGGWRAVLAAAFALAGPCPAHGAVAAPVPQVAAACDAPGVAPTWPRLDVVVTGIRRVAGNVTLTAYGDDPARFLKRAGSLLVTRVMLTSRQAALCVAVSRPGPYAIAVYHDENDNHHFDRNFLGLPTEGFGFSNNPGTLFGPPSFAAARVEIASGEHRIAIRLRYLN